MMRSMFGETSPGAGSPIQSVKGAGAKTLGPPPWPSYDSPSKIPLPKFLEGSPAARPRNEFRPRDLTGGENVDTLENEESTPKCLKPRPHAFFTPPRIREAGAVTGLAALTPISVNAMDGGAIAGRPVQTYPATGVKHLVVNLSSPSQSTSIAEKLVTVKIYGGKLRTTSTSPELRVLLPGIKKGADLVEHLELPDVGRTVVWNNAAFRADNSCDDQSPSTDSTSSTRCFPMEPTSITQSTFNESPNVCESAGGLPRIDELCSTLESFGGFPTISVCRHEGKTMYAEELPGMVPDNSSMVTLSVCPNLGTIGATTARSLIDNTDNSFLSASSWSSVDYIVKSGLDVDCSSASNKPDYLVPEMCTPIHTAEAGGSDSMQENHEQRDCEVGLENLASTKKSLFNDASPLGIEGLDTSKMSEASIRPVSHLESDLACKRIAQRTPVLELAGSPRGSANDAETADLEQLSLPKESEKQGKAQVVISQNFLKRLKEANVEADLEDDIEREIEDEISEEILNLSQKLANLQAKLGAKRVKNGSMPAVMSCPVTPVLTPRDLKENIKEEGTQNQCGAGQSAARHRRGRSVAAKFLQPRSQEIATVTPETNSIRMKSLDSKWRFGSARKSKFSPQHLRRRMSLGPRVSFPSNAKYSYLSPASDKNAHASKKAQEPSQGQFISEDVPEETPSSGSFRSNLTDYVSKDQAIRSLNSMAMQFGPYPDNNRRFDWVKTLRSGGMGVGSRSRAPASSGQPHDMSTLMHASEGGTEASTKKFQEEVPEDKVRWRDEYGDYMAEEIEIRLQDLAKRTANAGTQSPLVAGMQASRCCGRVVASRYGNTQERNPEPRMDHNHQVDSKSKSLPAENFGCLERREALHLMKAGLTRGPSGKNLGAPSPYSKSKVVKSLSPKGNGGKRTRRKSVQNLQEKTGSSEPSSQEQAQVSDSKELGETWMAAKENFEAEYESFVGSDLERRFSDLFSAAIKSHCQSSGKGIVDTAEEKVKPSERADVRLKKNLQPAKRSFIRCIELVVDTGDKPTARRKTSGSWQPSSCEQEATCTKKKDEKMEETVHGFSEARSGLQEAHLGAQTPGTSTELVSSIGLSRPDQDCPYQHSASCNSETAAHESAKRRYRSLKTVCRLFGKDLPIKSFVTNVTPQVGGQGPTAEGLMATKVDQKKDSHDSEGPIFLTASKPVVTMDLLRNAIFGACQAEIEGLIDPIVSGSESRLEPDTELSLSVSASFEAPAIKNLDQEADRPVNLSVRARWKELIDALEKERNRLPKIRTETGTPLFTSPRDSGCVKRIARRVKAMEYFKLEDVSSKCLKDIGSGDKVEGDDILTVELKTSLEAEGMVPLRKGLNATTGSRKVKSNGEECPSSTDRSLQSMEKVFNTSTAERKLQAIERVLLEQKDAREVTVSNPSVLVQELDTRSRQAEPRKNHRKMSKNKQLIPGDEIEGLDLESFWCLVGEFEESIKTSNASIPASWTPTRRMRRPNCEEGA